MVIAELQGKPNLERWPFMMAAIVYNIGIHLGKPTERTKENSLICFIILRTKRGKHVPVKTGINYNWHRKRADVTCNEAPLRSI